ncbi:hypothetical protein BaRGS_00006680 [Batillaria attramentaria]|uniref:Uncharacterized protein n=1 Tax=Batillaria attramentaria TaxID=370345 RepID=A0ABD0LRW7_9CAEN
MHLNLIRVVTAESLASVAQRYGRFYQCVLAKKLYFLGKKFAAWECRKELDGPVIKTNEARRTVVTATSVSQRPCETGSSRSLYGHRVFPAAYAGEAELVGKFLMGMTGNGIIGND